MKQFAYMCDWSAVNLTSADDQYAAEALTPTIVLRLISIDQPLAVFVLDILSGSVMQADSNAAETVAVEHEVEQFTHK